MHSAQSDKASKASASPLHNSITPDQLATTMSTPSAAQSSDKRSLPSSMSPNQQMQNAARMEVAQSQGLVSPSGVPPKIDEGVEPD